MESPANAILILPGASPPAAAAARHGVEKSGNSRLKTRQTAPSASAAPTARQHRSPIPDPDRNTIGQPLLRRAAYIQSHGRRRLSPPAGISAINPVAKPGRGGQAVCYLHVSAGKTLLNSPHFCDLSSTNPRQGRHESIHCKSRE